MSVGEVLDGLDQVVLGGSELLGGRRGGFQEAIGLVGGESGVEPCPEYVRCEVLGVSCGHQTSRPAGGHPTTVLEEGGHRWVAVGSMPGLAAEHLDPVGPDRFDQTADQFQLDQIIGQLVDMKLIRVLGDPFFQCRPERTHLHSPNIRSMLQAAHDRFHGVVRRFAILVIARTV